ncbi:MAG: fimbrillin family protein [Alistipes sp.]|nr:fimbrillin family protein [Alistipes sp.]
MKKIYFLLAVAAMTMTGCSQSEVVERASDAQTGRINFASHVNKGTRAIDNASFDQFTVFGSYAMPTSEKRITVFNSQAVKKSGDGWTYAATDNDLRYWVKDGAYNFAAYGIDDNTLPAGTNANFRDDRYLNLTGFLSNGANQKDLVYAATAHTALETGNPVVAMEFKHVLSRISFVFKNSFPEGYTIKIDKFKVVNVRDKGNFYGSVFETNGTNPWVNPNPTTGEYETPERSAGRPEIAMNFPTDGESAASGQSATTEAAYVIPFAYTEANVHLEFHLAVTRTEGDQEIAIFDKTYNAQLKPEWVMGHQYRYTIDLTGSEVGLEPIVFSGTVGDWSDWEDVDAGSIEAGNLPAEL